MPGGGGGHGRHEPDGAGKGAAPEQGVLGSADDLDAVEVQHVHVRDRPAGLVHVVDEHSHVVAGRAGLGQAAHHHRGALSAPEGFETQAGNAAGQRGQVLDAALAQLRGGYDVDGQGGSRGIFRHAPGGHHDFLQHMPVGQCRHCGRMGSRCKECGCQPRLHGPAVIFRAGRCGTSPLRRLCSSSRRSAATWARTLVAIRRKLRCVRSSSQAGSNCSVYHQCV